MKKKATPIIIGEKYKSFTVLEQVTKESYVCRCDCGREIIMPKSNLLAATPRDCGCRTGSSPAPLKPGEVFGLLTVIEQVNKSDYRCRCKCGNEITIAKHLLKSGYVRSCGCMRRLNHTYGNLTVVDITEKGYRCRCRCGNEIYVTGQDLQNGVKSCGCLTVQPGDRFGQLTVVEEMEPYIYTYPDGRTQRIRKCLCVCDCGKKRIVRVGDLRSGKVKSCGLRTIQA